ncbi:MAG: NADH-quinone oxidoreductase subunit NuoE [Dysgonamonadaceae bacterium]|jgi:NADH-quinone oxidoreductase subunit E|nr:NADH-quinone oxidoreductase subunit NuoE [Dysgonamonadaceae bacterium]MDD3355377.1 NADH-quinone oxidoreductase subunit NuoE [Dysgonamonadaceae bacterium]MDD3726971.1 NADH-quinone oxidoreductase subunit NuoE [Dysgonamonadaceae bacterium]MDD4245741.1 NADH-quinone oxidoreductase subunit NuoE [Dysgonamonadaceae bacterium]MDD4604853.1 NADH-quinone oxidoreductase subunit NuoE [Dysgonamonadaceae bacterium]
MLSKEEIKLIEKEMAKFPVKSAASIESLKIVQDKQRWVSDKALAEVARILEMPVTELENVASFYNLIYRKPVGRHVIHLCESISCWVMGLEDILGYLNKKLGISYGETTEDDRFTLLPIQCLGDCDKAPAMMVDNDLYNNLTTEKIDDILQKYQ